MKFHLAVLLFFFVIFIFPASAQESGGRPGTQPPGGSPGTQPPGSIGCDPKTSLCNPIQAESFTEVIRRVANIAALIGLPIVVIMIIWTGAQFVFAGGDEKKLTAAKQSFFWTIIGALLVLGAFVIAAAIENFARQL